MWNVRDGLHAALLQLVCSRLHSAKQCLYPARKEVSQVRPLLLLVLEPHQEVLPLVFEDVVSRHLGLVHLQPLPRRLALLPMRQAVVSSAFVGQHAYRVMHGVGYLLYHVVYDRIGRAEDVALRCHCHNFCSTDRSRHTPARVMEAMVQICISHVQIAL